MWAAHKRLEATADFRQLEVLLYAGQSDWGTEARWVGKGSTPRSDWESSHARLLHFRESLQRRSEGKPLQLTEEEQLQRERAQVRAYLDRQKGLEA